MKSRKNIVFLGMMGSGKSSIGFLISKKLKIDFFDIDQLIEKELNQDIPKIFKTKGEKFFRDFEEKTTLNILKKRNVVVSLGGGAFLNKNIRDEVLTNHLSFWLKNTEETILKRIAKSSKRPIAMMSSKNELLNLMKKRSKIYSKAMYNIDCNNLTKTEIAKKILNIYEAN
tara:strand:- start:1880 stop:2392 length:513 start_codon:yes stop_codon:yes gene_type:complete